jgi:P-type Cu2+ transporter
MGDQDEHPRHGRADGAAPPQPHGAHGAHATHGTHGDHAAAFRDRFGVALVLTVPILASSSQVQDLLGFTLPPFPGAELLAPVLGSIVYWWAGAPFLKGGRDELRARRPGMMVLIAMAITVAYTASLATALGWFDQEVWWELTLLITVMLLGHWIEMRAIGRAQDALAALAELLPDTADRLDAAGEVHTVPIDELADGDVVLVRPGGRVPADGTVTRGHADVDVSLLTGESNPVDRTTGDSVVAGAIVAGGSLRIRVSAVGEDTALAGIRRLVAEAQRSRSRAQVLADRAAALLFYVAVVSATATAIVWTMLGQTDVALDRAVTVLIIACPHALGLAIPLVTSISTSISARAGILVKDRGALERMRTIDTVLFDKTGTLTRGEHVVVDVMAVPGVAADDLLAAAGAAEADSEHPLARAIRDHASATLGQLPSATTFRALTGRGVEAHVDGARVAVGGPALLTDLDVDVPAELAGRTDAWSQRGAAILHVVRDGAVLGAIALEDEIRAVSHAAVADLHAAGLTVMLLTGDAWPVARAVAEQLDIDEVFAEVLPEHKADRVRELQQRGMRVAMVGDGVNDAPALATADVGIAIGAGTDVAIASAGIVLASDDPRGVVAIRRLSAATYRKMLQNLWWAAGYNIVAIPLAAGVLAGVGIVLPMALGAALMSLSTIIVALNAQLLRRNRIRSDVEPAPTASEA